MPVSGASIHLCARKEISFCNFAMRWSIRWPASLRIRSVHALKAAKPVPLECIRRMPAASAATPLKGNYERIVARLRKHTPAAYYFSPAPYAGAVGRLRAYLTDRSAARGARTPKEVLDGVLKRSLIA